ncbi:MAG: pyridoxamine 5'-phosphate oxidase [bacterium]|nr:pyridoxamine 5'-phosphate oxidase [bacterium]
MLDNKALSSIRQEYTLKEFDESHLNADPMMQFEIWFKEAIGSEVIEPNAMTLSTVKHDGKPSSRVVLLKGIDPNGFVFYTNYDSNKGRQLNANPDAALLFFWPELQRQVRIEGKITKNSQKDSDAYFSSRPKESQIGAHASPQSTPIPSRAVLEENFKKFEGLFATAPIVRPVHWGGYILEPISIEFWQGRANRMHDRFLFNKTETLMWTCTRLAP